MFRDRLEAALRLARELGRYRGAGNAIILAVPRGGLPIGSVLARELDLKLDVILTKKIGHPANPEFAIGAVSLTDEVLDRGVIESEAIPSEYIFSEIERIRASLRSRYRMYRGASNPLSVTGKTVILTDDGAATGRTLFVAIDLLRRQAARKIVVALPVAPPDTVELLKKRADEVVCLDVPDDFMAIGQYYGDFSQISDEEAVDLLKGAPHDVKGAR
ncbi:MAG: phosphoribosyltransferase [Elusimicrobia bacterium]|nr:phosphoribosyltransferase [Elusimicrobiota bacterium]